MVSNDIITSMDRVPAFNRVLNTLPGCARFGGDLVALEVDDNLATLLIAPTKWGSHDQHEFERGVRTNGFAIKDYWRCDQEIIASLISHDKRAKEVSDSHGESELIKVFDDLNRMALKERASDIHVERRESTVVKMRVFGEIFPYRTLSNETADKLVRLSMTVLSDEGNKPESYTLSKKQQASITRTIDGITVKLRAQSSPAYSIGDSGQQVVYRVLPMMGTRTHNKSLGELGYFEDQQEMLEAAVTAPAGVAVIAGETGSGKSTTADNMLRMIINEMQGRAHIITVEDPIEFVLPGATQLFVNRNESGVEKGSNPFAETMRAAMRMDPDYIMVSEVRDEESAQLLQRMVMSGHSALTTVHTGSALKIPMRLHDLGIDLNILASPDFFSVLVFQKLLQVVCPECSIPYDVSTLQTANPKMHERLMRVTQGNMNGIRVRGAGCSHCKDRGIVGRTVCAEVVQPDFRMLDFFRIGDEKGAIRHWRGDTGISKTALGSAVRKMCAGKIDPSEFENAFGRGTYLRMLSLD